MTNRDEQAALSAFRERLAELFGERNPELIDPDDVDRILDQARREVADSTGVDPWVTYMHAVSEERLAAAEDPKEQRRFEVWRELYETLEPLEASLAFAGFFVEDDFPGGEPVIHVTCSSEHVDTVAAKIKKTIAAASISDATVNLSATGTDGKSITQRTIKS